MKPRQLEDISEKHYLPRFDLAVRSTPKGSEALGYSLLISVWNIGLMIGRRENLCPLIA